MSGADHLRRWSQLHAGLEPAGLVGRWLRITRVLARGPARVGLGPDVITAAGLLVGVSAVLPALAGGRWALLAAGLVAGSALLDGLDGALAVLTGRVTRWGAVLDASCDRLTEAAFGAALWALGAPGPAAFGAVAAGWLHEYVRARAAAAGMDGVGRITVAERPTRVLIAVMFLLGAGLFTARATAWATAGAFAGCLLGAVGLWQLVRAVRRALP